MMPSKVSLRAVNILLMLVVFLQLANVLLMGLPQYVRLILNEIFFVFLPAYLYLRLTRQPLAERVRWHWPGWKQAVLSLLIGLGLYPLAAAGAEQLMRLLGYASFITPPDAIPTSLLMAVLAVIAYAVMAPLCEEFLFRGVVQPVYEQRWSKWAVLWVGLLFIAFHLSLLQGLSIILLALVLGFVNYRTRSLPASVLTHLGANFPAALVITHQVFKTGIENWITSLPAVLGGLAISVSALMLLVRQSRPLLQAPLAGPETGEAASPALAAAPVPARASWIAAGWPLLVIGLIFLLMAAAEFFVARSPLMAAQTQNLAPLEVRSAPWQPAQTWAYEVRNVADEVVGDGECQIDPQGAENELVCTSRVVAYEVRQGSSTFSSAGGERVDRLRWQAADGQLLRGASDMRLADGSYRSETHWSLEADAIHLRTQAGGEPEQRETLPLGEAAQAQQPPLLVAADNTWPWQLAGIPLEQGAGGSLLRFHPNTWRSATQDSGPVLDHWQVTVSGPEHVLTPAGAFTAWKVMLGSQQAAWYEAGGSRRPVKFFNGIETWALK